MSDISVHVVLDASNKLQERRNKIKSWQWKVLEKELKEKFFRQEEILLDAIQLEPKDHQVTMEAIQATHRGLDAVEEYFKNYTLEEDEIPF